MADANNLKIEQEINRLLNDRRSMLAAQTREMQSQLQLSLQIKSVVDGMKADEMLDRLNEAQKVFEQVAEKAKGAGTAGSEALEGISKGAEKATVGSNKLQLQMKLLTAKFPVLKSVSTAALSGLSQGFTNLLALGRGVIGVTEGLVSGIFNIGKAIISIPLNIFRNLLETAAGFTGDTSLAQAFEDLRKAFGSFKEDISKNVIGAFHEVQKGLTGTGLSAWKVFGPLANQLKYFHEVAEGAGAQMHQFGEEIKNSAGYIAAFDKGLGVGKDNIKAYMDLATVKGQSLNKTLLTTANYSLQMGEAFGMSQKVLAKDISAMMKDVKNFGSLTQKEMSIASVYTRKLGLEVKNLLGLIDKFDTFEDAANSAAQLSQAFGGSVDAFKLMQEQDPAKRLDMLRQSMAAAGKTTENMTRQELKLLEQTTGLDAASAKLAFSTKNQGISYDQVRKQAEKSEKKQLSQADAMAKLADSIERFIMAGQQLKGSFFDMFIHGFEQGVKWSKPFIDLMMNLRRALMDTMWAGRAVGQEFVKAFPGVTKMMTSLSQMFDAGKWKGLLDQVTVAFSRFFVDLDVGDLIKHLRNGFFSYFDSNSTQGREFLTGMKSFLAGLAKIAATGVKFVVTELTKGLKSLVSFIKDPMGYMKSLEATASAEAKEWAGLFQPLLDVVQDKKLWNDLADSVMKMLETLWDKVIDFIHGPTFKKIAAKVMPALLGIVLGPAVTRTALTLSLETFVKGITGQLGGAAKDVAKGAEAASKSAGIAANQGGVFSALLGNPYVAIAAGVAIATVAGVGMKKGLDKFGNKLVGDVNAIGDKVDKAAGASAAGLVQMLSFGAISDEAAYEMAKNISKLSDTFFKKLTGVFGPDLTKRIKKQFEVQMAVLFDLGDLFSAITKGDAGGIAKSVGRMLYDILRLAVNQMMFLFVDLPTKLLGWLSDVLVSAANSIDSLFNSGASGEQMLEQVVDGIEKFFLERDFPDVTAALGKMLEVVFTKLLPAIGQVVQSLTGALFRALWKGVKWVFSEVFGLSVVMEPIGKFFTDVETYFNEKVQKLAEKVKGLLDKVIPPDIQKSLAEKAAKILPSKPLAVLKTREELSLGGVATGQGDAQKAAIEEAKKQAEKTEGLDSKLQAAKMTLDTTKELTEQLKKFDVQQAVDEISTSMSKIDFSKLDTKIVTGFETLSRSVSDFITGLSASVEYSEKKIMGVLNVTHDIIKSVQELNNVLSSGDATKIKLTESLKKFADNSGLGKSGTYTVTNKGIVMHVHFEVKMNAAEVEEAIVLRHDSIIKDGIKNASGLNTEETNKLKPYIGQ